MQAVEWRLVECIRFDEAACTEFIDYQFDETHLLGVEAAVIEIAFVGFGVFGQVEKFEDVGVLKDVFRGEGGRLRALPQGL